MIFTQGRERSLTLVWYRGGFPGNFRSAAKIRSLDFPVGSGYSNYE